MALNPKYMIAPNIQEIFVDKDTGLPLTEGFVFFYKDNARSDLKTVYELTGAPGSYDFTPLENPLELGAGGVPVNDSGADIRIYYYPYDDNGNVENYYIRVTDKFGNTKLTRQAWPNVSDDTSVASYAYNFVRNSTFYLWNNATTFTNVKTGSVNITDYMLGDWTYEQDDASQEIDISQGVFVAGDDSVPGNPPRYLIYHNNNAGNALGTYNRFRQTYQSVQTLNGNVVAASIWVNQATGAAGTFSLTLTQYFGAGGSPSVTTEIITVPSLTVGSWTLYSGSVTLPSITGKTVASGDLLILSLNMPLNQTAQIFMSSVRLENNLQIQGSDNEISVDDLEKQTNSIGLYPTWTTGDVKNTLKSSADIGWLMMDDNTIGNPSSSAVHKAFSYYALYEMIWTNVHTNSYAQIYDSAGAPSTYGASAKSDWDLNKSLSLTKALGRVLGGAAPSGVNFSKFYTRSGNQLIIDNTSPFTTGNVVEFSATNLPTGLLPSPAQYYVIVMGATAVSLATTRHNAVSGVAITLSGASGGGLAYFVGILPFTNLGEYIGEYSHFQSSSELASHVHDLSSTTLRVTEDPPAGANPASIVIEQPTAPGVIEAGFVFGSTSAFPVIANQVPFPVVQPTVFYNVMIKL